MSTRRRGGDDGATVRPHPLSASHRFPSPSLQKENSNPRRSTSSSQNKTLPRGRSSSPSDLRPSLKPKPTTAQNPKPSTTRSSLELNKNPQFTTTTNNDSNAKYPSRLHEKLAFLEGKVKRIASDIKKTKEMLDMNNPDASKVILSDIQDKISGIEKAMVHVVEGDQDKTLVKGLKLNSHELEARLFPSPVHDKEEGKVNAGGRGEEKGGGGGSLSDQKNGIDVLLAADEKLEEFDDQENKEGVVVGEEIDEAFNFRLNGIGSKVASCGWFVSEGEAVLLAHHDGSCTYYDITNCEEKAVYMPPPEVSSNIWRDCWVIRAPGSDGCSGRFVVAASAGNTMDSGFCSWDFYTKEVRALQVDGGTTSSRIALRPLPNNVQRRNSTSSVVTAETKQWWYRPCGPLVISTASSQKSVKVFDVRDGEQIMKWDVQKPALAMDYSSPLQWRNRGKVVVAEAESISLWDVNSLTPHALVSVPSSGRKVSALHVSNTDAELGGGVRKRVSSSEAEGNDGVFCTSDSINILDFRQPSGIGLRISKLGVNVQSIFSRGDSIFLGCSSTSSMGKKQSSMLQQFSLRRQGLFATYALPESNAHSHHAAISQVWGNSYSVMGVCGLGLSVFDAVKDDELRVLDTDYSSARCYKEVIGPDDMYCPSFDYLGSRALLISRDRPAMWRHLIV